MSDAPERIWANFRNWRNPHEGHCYKHDDLGGSEYVRADVVDALVAEKVREALTKGRDEGLLAAAMWHQEVSDHDAQGMEYSSLVGIPIANWKELDVSANTHNWCRDEILSLRDQKEPKG